MIAPGGDCRRLRRLWDAHRRAPFPGPAGAAGPAFQEVALYASWIGSIVELALAADGRLSPSHRRMVEVRRMEGNQAIWRLAAELGEPARSYLARLIAIEEILLGLPAASGEGKQAPAPRGSTS